MSFVCSLFISVFMVGFAPAWMTRILEPVVRLLASIPSVIYGLIGVLVLVPFIGNHLITQSEKASVTPVIPLSGYSLLAAVVILTVMTTPVMIAIFSEGLRSVPRGWMEGSLALGVNQLADVLEDRRADRPTGTDRRHGAGHRARARRVRDAQHGVRHGRLRARPRRRADLPVRALAWAGADDPAEQRRADLAADGAHAVTRSRRYCCSRRLMLSLIGWAAKQPMKRYFNLAGGAA